MKKDSIQKLNANIERLLQQEGKPLSLSEAAKYLNISKSTLYKKTCSQLISFYKPTGKNIYFLKSDLNKYLLRNKRVGEQELEQKAIDYVTQGSSL